MHSRPIIGQTGGTGMHFQLPMDKGIR